MLYSGNAQPKHSLVGRVSSTDSLQISPTTLYLTLDLQNNLRQKVTVQEVDGVIQLLGRQFRFSATADLHDTPIPKDALCRSAVAIPLNVSADSLALLRAALATGSLSSNALRLAWRARYSTKRLPQAISDVRYYSSLPPLSQH